MVINLFGQYPGATPVDVALDVNFQPAGATTPDGMTADEGLAFDPARGFGWLTLPGAPVDVGDLANDRGQTGVAPRMNTNIRMETDVIPDRMWEVVLPNGDYSVTVSVGDVGWAGGVHQINAEGEALLPPFAITDDAAFSIVTQTVTVEDGRLTLDSLGGQTTRINWVEIDGLAPDAPRFTDMTAGLEPLANLSTDVARDADFAVDAEVLSPGDSIDAATVSNATVTLYEVEGWAPVAGVVNTTGGRESISFTPLTALEPDTQYALVVDGVADEDGQPFQRFSRTFTTGDAAVEGTAFDFASTVVAEGNPITTLTLSPSGGHLYAATLLGQILRWPVEEATGALGPMKVFDGLAGDDPDGPRAIIGLAFDPTDDGRLWVSHNDTLFEPNSPDFTGRVSYVDLRAVFADSVVTDVIVGLPRSIRDHMTNSIAFGPDGLLYLSQGANGSLGAPDPSWGGREERLLTAAILQIDPELDLSAGPLNVQTEDYTDKDGVFHPSNLVADGGGFDPFDPSSAVKLYATGIRNGYDLVWDAEGRLYVPVNGTGAGGNAPDDPATPIDESIEGAPTLPDILLRVPEPTDQTTPDGVAYFGHPNVLRDEYIAFGGNPTAGADPFEVVDTPSGSFTGYVEGVAPDANFRADDIVFDFGLKRSPNGIDQYTADSFGGALNGALLVAEYSRGDQIRGLQLDAAGGVAADFVVAEGFANPLDLVVDDASGRIYVAEFGAADDLTDDRIILLSPVEHEPPLDTGVTLMGGPGIDALTGGAGDDSLRGRSGGDTLSGLAGDDTLRGDDGYDRLDGGAGADTLTGGRGDDVFVLRPGDGADLVTDFDLTRDMIDVLETTRDDLSITSDGDDAILAVAGASLRLIGTDAALIDDTHLIVAPGAGPGQIITGTDASEALRGGGGDDVIFGDRGSDQLFGGAGDDQLFGGKGYDRLDGGAGDDEASGGAGRDQFVLAAGGGADLALDFEDGVDKVRLAADPAQFSAVTFTDGINGAEIGFADALLILDGVDSGLIDIEDFVFG